MKWASLHDQYFQLPVLQIYFDARSSEFLGLLQFNFSIYDFFLKQSFRVYAVTLILALKYSKTKSCNFFVHFYCKQSAVGLTAAGLFLLFEAKNMIGMYLLKTFFNFCEHQKKNAINFLFSNERKECICCLNINENCILCWRKK